MQLKIAVREEKMQKHIKWGEVQGGGRVLGPRLRLRAGRQMPLSNVNDNSTNKNSNSVNNDIISIIIIVIISVIIHTQY